MPAPTKPGTIYVWDSGGVHLVVPTGGHLASGFVNNEIPGSGEINALFQNWGLELAWLDYQVSGMLAAQTIWQFPGYTVITGGTGAGSAYGSTTSDMSVLMAAGGPTNIKVQIAGLPAGTVIQSASVVYEATPNTITGSASNAFELFVINALTGSTSASASASGPTSSRAVLPLTTSSTLPYTLVNGDTLFLIASSSVTSGCSATLHAIGLSILPV